MIRLGLARWEQICLTTPTVMRPPVIPLVCGRNPSRITAPMTRRDRDQLNRGEIDGSSVKACEDHLESVRKRALCPAETDV